MQTVMFLWDISTSINFQNQLKTHTKQPTAVKKKYFHTFYLLDIIRGSLLHISANGHIKASL